MIKKTYFFSALLAIPFLSYSQDTIRSKSAGSSINMRALEVQESLSKEEKEVTAQKYEDLAKSLVEKKDFAKAEIYLKKALGIYQEKKNKAKIASVTRSLAQVQESQMNIPAAMANYQSASENAVEVSGSRLNSNDLNRLKKSSSPAMQSEYLNSNIKILKSEGKLEEVAIAYIQKAETELKSENIDLAIDNYEKALEISKGKPEEVLKIKSEISKVYEQNNQLGKAIEITSDVLLEAVKTKDLSQQISQNQALAHLLLKQKDEGKAIELLTVAYELALKNNRTLEAKEAMLALSDYYQTKGEQQKSIQVYNKFFNGFETMVKSDTTLMDANIFQVNEEKIRQLETERTLKDELIFKKNKLNYVLIGSILLMVVLLGFILKSIFAINTKNKKIALQSLRREMNPHFIFNSLNSVNQFISQNNELKANKYLTSYSNLMRNMMETSNKDFVSLSTEMEQIKKYLDLEHLRFHDKFDFEISVDKELDTDSLLIPNMLIQPHLENAIWHGLRYRTEKGLLKFTILNQDRFVKILISDNGIGLGKSMEIKTKNQKVHKSRGLNNVRERIKLLNELYKQRISFSIMENPIEHGTVVEIYFSKLPFQNNGKN